MWTPAQPCFRSRKAVTVPALWPGSLRRLTASERIFLVGALLCAGSAANPTPAAAQLAASIAIETDYRFRAHLLSDGRPAATVQLAYDHASGLYLNVAAIGALGDDGPRFVGAQGNIGYAARLAP